MKKLAALAFLTTLALLASAFHIPGPLLAPALSDIQVNTLDPTAIFGDGLCSLSEAIVNANANSQVGSTDCTNGLDHMDKIFFTIPGTVTLSSDLPAITDGVEIHGHPLGTTISGADAYKIFKFDPTATTHVLVLEELTVEHGYAGDLQGGALRKLKGTAEVRSCMLRFNRARLGGALYNGAGDMMVVNSTVYGNAATTSTEGSAGGGLLNASGWTVRIYSSIFAANQSSVGGSNLHNSSGVVMVYNSIVANGTTSSNCAGTITDMNNNIDSANSCGFITAHGSLVNADPLFGEPGWYGGPTETIPLLPGSPAIDGVTYNAPNSSPDFDQRNFPRPRDGDGDGTLRHDIGAYEFGEPKVYLPVVVR